MSVGPFIVELVVAVFITLCILHQYGNWRKQHFLVTIAVFISWYFSFLVVFILPLDVSSVSVLDKYPNREPSHGPKMQSNSYIIVNWRASMPSLLPANSTQYKKRKSRRKNHQNIMLKQRTILMPYTGCTASGFQTRQEHLSIDVRGWGEGRGHSAPHFWLTWDLGKFLVLI